MAYLTLDTAEERGYVEVAFERAGVPQPTLVHPTLGPVITDTWGRSEWAAWWHEYHKAGGQHHVGEEWPVDDPGDGDPRPDLIAAAAVDPPLQEEVLALLQDVISGFPGTPTDYSARRTQLEDDIDTLRAWVAIGRDDLAALQAIPEPTWQQELFIKILKFLILFSKVIWNALLRPQAGDLDPIPESAKILGTRLLAKRAIETIAGKPVDSDPEVLARRVRSLTAQARIGMAVGGGGLIAAVIALLLVVL